MAGGTEHQLVTLISQLERQRFTPYVICLYGERAGRSLHFLEELRQLKVSVFLLDLGWSVQDKLYGLAAIMRIIWRVRPHVVQAVNYHSNLLTSLARPALPPSLKLIGCVYIEYTWKQLLYEHMAGWLCTATVCNSEHLRRHLPRYLSPQLISNGVDSQRFSQNPDPTLRECLASESEWVLLILGRITAQKSPHLLVEALGLLKRLGQLPMHISVWIVGESEDNNIQRILDESIRRCDLEDVVKQLPPTSMPEAFYHAADVTILASLWEGLPNVLLESMAAGKPVIVSEAANKAGLIKQGQNGWIVRTSDVESLAITLRNVFALPESKLTDMGTACQETAARFSVSKMVEEYETLYNCLTARL